MGFLLDEGFLVLILLLFFRCFLVLLRKVGFCIVFWLVLGKGVMDFFGGFWVIDYVGRLFFIF